MKIKTKELKELRKYLNRGGQVELKIPVGLDFHTWILDLINQELKRRKPMKKLKKFMAHALETAPTFKVCPNADAYLEEKKEERGRRMAILGKLAGLRKMIVDLPYPTCDDVSKPDKVNMVIDTRSGCVMGCFYEREDAEKYKADSKTTVIAEHAVE